jgi:integrase
MPTLMQRLQDASINPVTRCLIEWQLHTMTRPSEAAGARWEEIDLAEALWTIPANRMKAGKEHTVPLTKAVMTLLQRMQPISAHRAYVFPSNRDYRKHVNSSTANMALKRMGYHGKLVSHGLRSLASTTLNEQGFNHDVIEAALAHKDSNEVRAAYNRAQYIERRRALMESWSQQILAAKQGQLYTPSIESLRIVNAI